MEAGPRTVIVSIGEWHSSFAGIEYLYYGSQYVPCRWNRCIIIFMFYYIKRGAKDEEMSSMRSYDGR